MNTNGIFIRVNSCPLVVSNSASHEFFKFARSKCDSEWPKRNPAGLRLLFHPAKESDRSQEMHDLRVCDFDAVSDLLSHLSRESGQDGFQRSGLVPAMVFDVVIHAYCARCSDCADDSDHVE